MIGTCRSEGCDQPRRVRRGTVEPLCESCYRAACRRVAAQLAAEDNPQAARRRYRQITIAASPAKAAPASPRTAPPPAPRGAQQQEPVSPRRPRGRPRLINDALLEEARRRHHDEYRPLSQIAAELLQHTAYANAHSATAALRRQFKQRGWLTTRAAGGGAP
jgi:hypothetical protein